MFMFLYDGQGAVMQAILYADRYCIRSTCKGKNMYSEGRKLRRNSDKSVYFRLACTVCTGRAIALPPSVGCGFSVSGSAEVSKMLVLQ